MELSYPAAGDCRFLLLCSLASGVIHVPGLTDRRQLTYVIEREDKLVGLDIIAGQHFSWPRC